MDHELPPLVSHSSTSSRLMDIIQHRKNRLTMTSPLAPRDIPQNPLASFIAFKLARMIINANRRKGDLSLSMSPAPLVRQASPLLSFARSRSENLTRPKPADTTPELHVVTTQHREHLTGDDVFSYGGGSRLSLRTKKF